MWPDGIDLGPIREWPGALTPDHQRRVSSFKTSEHGSYRRKSTPLSSTLELLNRELSQLGARDRTLLVAIAAQDFRLDGKPRAQAKSSHPGVILSFATKYGPLSYAVDTFTTWQDNLRAIALGLEALRKVDRYGVTKHGEQYRGFLAIESARPMPAGFATADEALAFLREIARESQDPSLDIRRTLRRAQQASHPDTGGDAGVFGRVSAAESLLRAEGVL